MRKFRIHPITLTIFFSIVVYGDIALYAMLFGSLLVHEVGHIIAAHLCKMTIKSCVLYPYGAEIIFVNGEHMTPRQMFVIALAGPFATLCLAVSTFFMPQPFHDHLLSIQMYLLLFNMLPIWSLDGGRAIYACILMFFPLKQLYEAFVESSFIMVSLLMIGSAFLLPKTLSLFIVSFILWIQVWKEWKYRKYRATYEKVVLNRLT